MIAEILIFILTTLVAFAFYSYYKNQNVFKSKDMKFLPGFPMFGNIIKSSFGKNHMFYDLDRVYRAFPGESYVGYVEGFVPLYLIRDPSIIRLITVKDFDHFVDHRRFATDDLFNESLFMMTGDRWRDMRSTLSPAFTGSKMRKMVPFMCQTSQNIVEHLKETEGQNINVGELIRRYTNDVIASTAFGIEVNSVKDQKNRFYEYGQKIINFSSVQKAKIFLSVIFPKSGFQIFPKDSLDFFKHIVTSTMEYREKNNVERPDMIQLLMEASKGTLDGPTEDKSDTVGFATTELTAVKPKGEVQKWSMDQLAAQAFIFFLAGFDSTASVLVMAFHELALNPEVQETLYQEVKEHHEKHGTVTYDGVPTLKYLDGVLNETLRKWPPTLILDRVCQKPYTLPPPREGGKPYTVKEGEVIFNFVNSLHMDEKYYPEPEKFKPERFSDENKQNIKLSAFIPFGSGPRSCIASRFAILELKVLLYYVSLNFILQKCEKTRDPIELTPGEFQVRCIGGSWVKFQARK